jgi:hypothetical protein
MHALHARLVVILTFSLPVEYRVRLEANFQVTLANHRYYCNKKSTTNPRLKYLRLPKLFGHSVEVTCDLSVQTIRDRTL